MIGKMASVAWPRCLRGGFAELKGATSLPLPSSRSAGIAAWHVLAAVVLIVVAVGAVARILGAPGDGGATSDRRPATSGADAVQMVSLVTESVPALERELGSAAAHERSRTAD